MINKPSYLGLSILEINTVVIYEFVLIMWNQNIETKQNYVTLHKIFKQDLIHLIMN